MTIAHRVRMFLRRYGVDVHRFDPVQSPQRRITRLLEHHRINAVIDVGANDGGFGKYIREGGYYGDLLSFEPLDAAHQALSVAAAKDPRWHVAERIALGNKNDQIVINISANLTSSSILSMRDEHVAAAPNSEFVDSETVPMCRLDAVRHSVLRSAERLYLKIDTQGFEMPVLEGASALLPKVYGMQVELSLVPLYDGQKLYEEIISWLGGMGFELWNVVPGFSDPRSGRMLQMDGVFFRRNES